ncbi:hypothetical protein BGZ95_003259, partial [Linnemannia exigua]
MRSETQRKQCLYHWFCECKSAEKVCASAFGDDCKLEAGCFYSRPVKGMTLEFEELCKNGCVEASGNDKCSSDEECQCRDDKATRGSSWPTSCGFKANAIYKCNGDKDSISTKDTNCDGSGGCEGVDGV